MSDTQKMFLTYEELVTLTGRKRAARQGQKATFQPSLDCSDAGPNHNDF